MRKMDIGDEVELRRSMDGHCFGDKGVIVRLPHPKAQYKLFHVQMTWTGKIIKIKANFLSVMARGRTALLYGRQLQI